MPMFLCFVIISIPLGSIYMGYLLGEYLKPDTSYLPDRGVVLDTSRLDYNYYNTHNTTINLGGGLGNQMFQYAAMYGIAKANGLKPYMPKENNHVMAVFPNVKAEVSTGNEKEKFYRFHEMKPMEFDTRSFSLNFMKNIRIEGWFQSWRYFDHVRADLRKQFRCAPEIEDRVMTFMKDCLHEYGASRDETQFPVTEYPVQLVGVHVRRGDLLEKGNVDKGYVTADESYVRRAMTYFVEKYKNVIFVICTDDEKWSKQHTTNFPVPVLFSPFLARDPAYDLCVLSHCNHTVMTVGTFGWWGAWLAGGETIYYRYFPKSMSELARLIKPSDFFLPQWMPV